MDNPNTSMTSAANYFKKLNFYDKDILVASSFSRNDSKISVHHDYPYITFLLCQRGSATLYIDDYSRELKAGCQLIVLPHSHGTLTDISRDFDCSIITLSQEVCSKTHRSHNIPLYNAQLFFKKQPLIYLPREQQDFFEKMRDIIVLAIKNTAEEFKKRLIVELVQSFLAWQQTVFATLLNSPLTSTSSQDLLTVKFIHLVSKNFLIHHRLEYYANAMCITPKYLSSVIKEITGYTASRWINFFLINEAKRLLTVTTLSVADISEQLGFSNQSFFGKFFKHYTGKSPLAFRQNKE